MYEALSSKVPEESTLGADQQQLAGGSASGLGTRYYSRHT